MEEDGDPERSAVPCEQLHSTLFIYSQALG